MEKTCFVCMTVYNGVRYLRDAVESVLAQSAALHVCIVDDGSNDGSAEMLKQYADRFPKQIKVLTNSRNEGIGRALSRALACRTDESYFAMIGQDDIWHPDFLRSQISCLEENDAIAAFSDVHMIDENGAPLSGSRFVRFDHARIDGLCQTELLAELIRGNFLCAASCTVDLRKMPNEPLNRLFGASNDRMQDWECWLNLCQCGAFVHNPATHICYRSHSGNFSDPNHHWLQAKLELYSTLQRTLGTERFWRCISQSSQPDNALTSVLLAIYDKISYSNPCRLLLMELCESAMERGYDTPKVRQLLAEMYQQAGLLSKAYRLEGRLPMPIPLTFSDAEAQTAEWPALEKMGIFSLQPPQTEGALPADFLTEINAGTCKDILTAVEDRTTVFRDGILDAYPVQEDNRRYLESLRRNAALLDSRLYKLLRRLLDRVKRKR